MMLWMVEMGNVHVITSTVRADREEAKRNAHKWIGANPDTYVVTPLTAPGDRVKLDITMWV